MSIVSLREREYGLLSPERIQRRSGYRQGLSITAEPARRRYMRLGPFLVIAILLLLAWGGSFLMFHLTSGLIHVLLVLAVLSFIFHFITGRRAV